MFTTLSFIFYVTFELQTAHYRLLRSFVSKKQTILQQFLTVANWLMASTHNYQSQYFRPVRPDGYEKKSNQTILDPAPILRTINCGTHGSRAARKIRGKMYRNIPICLPSLHVFVPFRGSVIGVCEHRVRMFDFWNIWSTKWQIWDYKPF